MADAIGRIDEKEAVVRDALDQLRDVKDGLLAAGCDAVDAFLAAALAGREVAAGLIDREYAVALYDLEARRGDDD